MLRRLSSLDVFSFCPNAYQPTSEALLSHYIFKKFESMDASKIHLKNDHLLFYSLCKVDDCSQHKIIPFLKFGAQDKFQLLLVFTLVKFFYVYGPDDCDDANCHRKYRNKNLRSHNTFSQRCLRIIHM